MFSSLRIRNYRLYFAGQSVSVAGNWMQNVALSWLALQLSGNGAMLGLVIAVRFLPVLLLGPWGGLLADSYDQRRMLYITHTSAGFFSALLALTAALNVTQLWMVVVLTACIGCVNAMSNPARQSLISNMVGPQLLANAITLNSVTMNAARVLGPVFSGVLIATLGIAWCFALNALSFGAAILSLALMNGRELLAPETAGRAPGRLRQSFRYAWQMPELRYPLILIMVAGAFAWEFQVTLPLVATYTFHQTASTYGAMLSAVGAGAIIGGLVVARRSLVRPKTLALSAIFWGITILGAASAPNIQLELVALFFVGYGAISFNSVAKTLLQLAAVPMMRGRIMAMWAMAWQGTTPIGAPIVGWIGQEWGGRWSLVAGAVPTILVGLLVLPKLAAMSLRVGQRDGVATPDVDV